MPIPLLHFDRDASHQLELGLTHEWVEADGLGGYAASTILMCPTRRYHGLLVTAPPGTTHRHVFLSRFEETLHGGGKSFPLSIARYPGLWSPHGHDALESFDLVPYPAFTYRIGNAHVLREVLAVHGQPTVLCRYRVSGQSTDVELQLRPLLAFRRADRLTHENIDLSPKAERLDRGIRVRPYASLPPMTITLGTDEFHFEADPVWYRNLEYQADIDRGYDGHEDQFCPGVFHVPLHDGVDVIVASSIEDTLDDPHDAWIAASSRRRDRAAGAGTGVRAVLSMQAEDFLYSAPDGRTGVIAGFPWFNEWGRDTFIALPGLTLSRGKLDQCGDVLEGALPYLRDGLMPNIFGTGPADSHYGSVDASLWFARAVQLYDDAGGSPELLADSLLPALRGIAEAYGDGTDLGVRCDDHGLIEAGDPALNATWMDARVDDVPVTPRNGFAVEINALWYALLRYLADAEGRIGQPDLAADWAARADRTAAGFLDRFWLPEAEYLADLWHEGVADDGIRPNMVIAAALEHSPLSQGKRVCVVRTAEAELLTPRGLRTLAPEFPAYKGRYDGDQAARDNAYHQGTVWPWLLGFFVEASLRAYGPEPERVSALRGLLDGFDDHLSEAGLDHISEVFDGDAPHRPGGTIAQAWNVGEMLRAYRLLEEAGL